MITLVQVRSHGMAKVANGELVSVRIAVGVGQCWPYISVEATATGLAPHTYVESLNDPERRARPNLIETSVVSVLVWCQCFAER